MSFSLETLLWVIKVFFIYGTMIFVYPSVILKPILTGKSLSERFIINTVFGNFFYINIILVLGLFGLTERIFLVAATIIPLALRFFVLRSQIYMNVLLPCKKLFLGFIYEEISLKYILVFFVRKLKEITEKAAKSVLRCFKNNNLELLLFFISTGIMLYIFIRNIVTYYGYQTSDMVVHQLWINEVKNGLFYDGVYPFGMHAIIYYVHEMFDIPTVILMRVLPASFNFFIFTMMLAAMRVLCRFKYLPYIGYLLIFSSSLVQNDRLSRYFSPLPQEFGTMFYFPCLIAAVIFFREFLREEKDYKELKSKKLLYTLIGKKSRHKNSEIWRWVLIISFGLTLSAHFYVTIIAGVLVMAVLISYFKFLFKPACLKKIISAALLAVIIPIIPMAAAFVGGTPLQGSLYWATSIMGIGESNEETVTTEYPESSEEIFSSVENLSINEDFTVEANTDLENVTATNQKSFAEKLRDLAVNFINGMRDYYLDLMLSSEVIYNLFLLLTGTMLVLIPVFIFFKEWEYCHILAAVLCNQFFISVLGITGRVGLPVIIDENRMSCFQMYILPLTVVMAIDGIFLLFSKLIKFKFFWKAVSFLLVVVFAATSCNLKYSEKLISKSSFQTNGAAVVLYDVMKNYTFQKWTIVSCNEERTMMDGQGWHYEVIDFLMSMEGYNENKEMYIPTQYVFFFIEKHCLNYPDGDVKYPDDIWEEEINPYVSEEWASNELPVKSGITQYAGIRRNIVNSRMYYWALEYKKRYPNEFKVFYEDDDFICYYIKQNEYFLNNFAINYGYNVR